MVRIQKQYLKELIHHLKKQTLPGYWYDSVERIKKDADHLDGILSQANPPSIYGVNTLVGHLDNVTMNENEIKHFQQYLLENHSLGIGKEYNDFEVKCISYAKLHSYSLGGSAITPILYKNLLAMMKEGSLTASVPKHASYSSGDVIPAAHWASSVSEVLQQKYHYNLQRKEGLSLINGSFVHVGIAVARLLQIQPVWALYNYNSLHIIKLLKIRKTNFSKHLSVENNDTLHTPLEWVRESIDDDGEYDVQDPVSIRTYPQTSSAFLTSIEAFLSSIEEQLSRRSDNPLIMHEEEFALSQGSFIAPLVSLTTGQLIESVLLMMWQVERRIHFLLSGKVKGIPLNAKINDDSLGFIQVPKLVSAILEESRLIGGRRTFASGSSTSYGIEDMWTNGLSTLEVLNKLLTNMNQILAIELTVIGNVHKRFRNDASFQQQFEGYFKDQPFRYQYEKVAMDNVSQSLPISYNLEPFDDTSA